MFVSLNNVQPGDKFKYMSLSGEIHTRRVFDVIYADPEYAMSWRDRSVLVKLFNNVRLYYSPDTPVVWNVEEQCWEPVYTFDQFHANTAPLGFDAVDPETGVRD